MRRAAWMTIGVALAAAPPAAASDDPAQLAEAVERDVVHVDERASGRVSAAEAGRLRLRIARRDVGRIKILVVPAAAAERNGGLVSLTESVARLVDLRGALIAVAGGEVRVAASYDSAPAVAAVRRAMGGPVERRIAPDLERAVDEVARADPGASADASAAGTEDDPLGANDFLDDLGDTVRVVAFSVLGVIVLLLLTPLLVWRVRARRRRRAGEEDLEADRETARGDLLAVGETLRELDIDAEMPGADPVGREALASAIELYHRGDRELAKATTRPRLERARTTIDAARDQATIARRRLSQEASSSSGSGRVSP